MINDEGVTANQVARGLLEASFGASTLAGYSKRTTTTLKLKFDGGVDHQADFSLTPSTLQANQRRRSYGRSSGEGSAGSQF